MKRVRVVLWTLLLKYHWPASARELCKVIERTMILGNGEIMAELRIFTHLCEVSRIALPVSCLA